VFNDVWSGLRKFLGVSTDGSMARVTMGKLARVTMGKLARFAMGSGLAQRSVVMVVWVSLGDLKGGSLGDSVIGGRFVGWIGVCARA
jgi:hypothetical protein